MLVKVIFRGEYVEGDMSVIYGVNKGNTKEYECKRWGISGR